MVNDICENKLSGEFWFNPDNFPTFKSRLEILKLKLDHDPTLLDNIYKTLNDYESESITESEACPRTRYPALPHHPANKKEKEITKFKLIIDGSSHFKYELSLYSSTSTTSCSGCYKWYQTSLLADWSWGETPKLFALFMVNPLMPESCRFA